MIFLLKNPLFIFFILLMLFCIVRGARKGILKIIYGLVSWILLLWFVSIACGYISDYLNVNTPIPGIVQEHILSNLQDKYNATEAVETGTGLDAVMQIIPAQLRQNIDNTIHNSVEATIQAISSELSETAIKGISTVISVLLGVLILYILDRIIQLIGKIPGIHGVNAVLGIAAGCVEGLMITWFCMYLADCFPTTFFGQFVLSNCDQNAFMNYVYQINIIEQIIGI